MSQNDLNSLRNMINNESRALMMMQQGTVLALQLHNDIAKVFIIMQKEIERLSLSLARAEQTVVELETKNHELRKASSDTTSFEVDEELK